MKPFVYLVLATVIAAPAFATIDREVQKDFTVKPGGELFVDTNGGPIEVTPSSDSELHVTVHEHFRAGSESEADEIAKNNLEVKLEQSSTGVTVKTKCENKNEGSFWNLFSHSNVWVDVAVAVPTHYNAKLKTSGGGIRVEKLDGELYANTSGGPIELGQVSGKIQAYTSGGGIRLADGNSDTKLSTSGGPIKVIKCRGNVDLNTSGGGIHVDSVSGQLHADTSGGGITVHFDAALTGDSSLETSGGGIEVSVPKDKGAHIDASTSGGGVRLSGLEVTIESGKLNSSSLKGNIAGGGPTLRLRTSGGGIEINAD
jgi:Putative adhesin